MQDAKKLAMLEEILGVDEGSLQPDMPLADVEEYNSMAKLALIVLMSDEFGKKLTNEQVKSFQPVGDILAFMG